ncbi:serine/threonine-protein kinase PINK1, mitochondrial-like isoform X2 [Dendronephthya gigantea]|uniref:serine/threonine-protein kinase PINK1, mitochondrial-like isoform X2 n=1 Tax=Dendronephthya gigantea TaxID=151771 RepID=UPI00106BF9D2|nr:serine/threonine-protein kinase PINK1, mitochondrial-like isoform X2 [Dendronephthya gigantea]
MFRRALEAGFRLLRPVINRNGRNGIRSGAHSSYSSHENVVLQKTSKQPENFKTFFFSLWLRNTSRVSHVRCNPIFSQMVRNRRNPTSLFLAFVGFTYLGENENGKSRSDSCSFKEQQLHPCLQDMLQKTEMNIPEKPFNHNGKSLKDYHIKERLGKASCNSAVYAAEINGEQPEQYAIKMLHNYRTNSKSVSLTKAFSKELAILSSNEETQNIRDELGYTNLQDHYNVIKILGHFSDDTPEFYDAKESYPAALPSRLNPGGYGRNRTKFFVMQKFPGTLQDYISKHKDNLDTRKSIALLTQLLECLLHLYNKKVAHRDLKNDNILVDDNADGLPHSVVTDFDCALAEREIGFDMPYETDETSKGGNWLHMAPEIAFAKPGRGKKLDYSRSDEWAAGALAYEMFGQKHPFDDPNLKKESYEVTELPELKGAPKAIQRLVKELLQRHPNDRPDISLAATICQLLLWKPCMVHSKEAVSRWLEQETWTLRFDLLKYQFNEEEIPVEKQILLTFLRRASIDETMKAIEWLNQRETED